MRRIHGLDALGAPLVRSVVTIGKFSSLHRGHIALIDATRDTGRRLNASSVAMTFDRHPAEILRPRDPYPLLATVDERLDQLEAAGIDVALVLKITPDLLEMEPEAFAADVLADRLGAVAVICGENFRFGRHARGDLELLTHLGEGLDFVTLVVPSVLEGGEPISSSRIVQCITAGRVAEAAVLIGRPYTLSGEVVQGRMQGRTLGFPTANVHYDQNRLLPMDGVYAVRVISDRLRACVPGVANLGLRPTVEGVGRTLEVHLFDTKSDLYGSTLDVSFIERIRDETRFPNIDALKAQISLDAARAREILTREDRYVADML